LTPVTDAVKAVKGGLKEKSETDRIAMNSGEPSQLPNVQQEEGGKMFYK